MSVAEPGEARADPRNDIFSRERRGRARITVMASAMSPNSPTPSRQPRCIIASTFMAQIQPRARVERAWNLGSFGIGEAPLGVRL